MKPFTYAKLDAFVSSRELDELKNRFDKIKDAGLYLMDYSNISAVFAGDISNEVLFLGLMVRLKEELESVSCISNLDFDKLWLITSELKDIDKTKLPYIPHFDKRRYLKAMVYLSDVSENHGPIHFGKVKPAVDIEEKRIKLPVKYKELGLNSINDAELDVALRPIVGLQGDVILFDTNTPHKAGIVQKGLCRKVLRFDFEHSSFNPKPSAFIRIKTRLKRIFTSHKIIPVGMQKARVTEP